MIQFYDLPSLQKAVDEYLFQPTTTKLPTMDLWDVTHVKNMENLFQNKIRTLELNNRIAGIGKWNVSQVMNMRNMFDNCLEFNQDLSTWDVSQVKDFFSMFCGCSSFNQPLNQWNVRKAKTMQDMFIFCSNFNQPLSNWNVENVTNMENLFTLCETFDQDLSQWNVGKVTKFDMIFDGCKIRTEFKPPKFLSDEERAWFQPLALAPASPQPLPVAFSPPSPGKEINRKETYVWKSVKLQNIFESLEKLKKRIVRIYTHPELKDVHKLHVLVLENETLQLYCIRLNEFDVRPPHSVTEKAGGTKQKKTKRTKRTLQKQQRGGIVGWVLNRVVSARKKEIRDLSNQMATQGCMDKSFQRLLDRCQGTRFERNFQTRRTCSLSRAAYRRATKKLGIAALDVCDAAFLTFQEQTIALLDELQKLRSQPRFAGVSEDDGNTSWLLRLRALLLKINQRNYAGFLSELENFKNQLWGLVHEIQPELEKTTF